MRTAIERVLAGHEPYPAILVDRRWELVAANRAAALLVDGVAPELLEPPVNVLRASLHPDGLATRIVNLVGVGRAHHRRPAPADRGHRRRGAARARSGAVRVRDRSRAPRHRRRPKSPGAIAIPLRLRTPDGELAFITTIATFGTALDVTLAELAIEAFLPADDVTAARAVRGLRLSRGYLETDAGTFSRMPDSRDNDDESPLDRFFAWAETVVYVLVGAILIGGALVLLVESIVVFFETLDDGVVAAATETLSILLIVFIFVELLGAVRVIIREQRLIAEPFLLVGIIAAIKEIVVVAGAESPTDGDFAEFRDAMVEIGVLAGIVLLLAVAALLLRKREREPSEETEQPSARPAAKLRAVVVRLEDWFLTPGERGNDATKIDRRRGDGRSWTEGNHVRVLVHGAEYFTRLYARAVHARA